MEIPCQLRISFKKYPSGEDITLDKKNGYESIKIQQGGNEHEDERCDDQKSDHR